MKGANLKLATGLVDANYIQQGGEALQSRENMVKKLLSQRSLPDDAWDDITIEHFLSELALMDSNNFKDSVGFGEREGRVFSNLVSTRHYRLGHGIGRSGDITAVQPKAAGSSLISKLTSALALSCIKLSGITNAKAALVLPVATGMSIALTLMTLRSVRRLENNNSKQNTNTNTTSNNNNTTDNKNTTATTTTSSSSKSMSIAQWNLSEKSRYVLWLRIDQKACFKAIYTAGLIPVVIPTLIEGDLVKTDLNELRKKISEIGSDKILCVLSTTSCFAPRARDNVEEIAQICQNNNIGHVINNAYGLIDSKCCHAVNQACRVGRVDAFVQSTDKNLMVPVGGAIVSGPNKKFITAIGENYPGRASMSPILDLFITLLSMGKNGWKLKLKERKNNMPILVENLKLVAEKYGEKVLETSKGNNISIAVTCNGIANPTELGSWLFKRSVSGTRVVAQGATKTIGETNFMNWGASNDSYPSSYITFAASMGQKTEEIPILCGKLDAAFKHFLKKNKKRNKKKDKETKGAKEKNGNDVSVVVEGQTKVEK